MREKRVRNCELAILGAGISGLAAAREAQKRGIDYVLVEKAPVVGGLSRSIHVGDYVFDYAGHCLHLSQYGKPRDLAPVFRDEDWRKVTRNAKCYHGGRLMDAPFQYHLGQLPKKTASALYQSYLATAGTESPETASSFEEYLTKSFGHGIASSFLIPYNEKVLGGSLAGISSEAVTRFFPPPARRQIEAGYKRPPAPRCESCLYNHTFWYPRRNGIQLLVDGLSAGVAADRILTSAEVRSVNLETHTIMHSRGTIRYDSLISSIPFRRFLHITGLERHLTKHELSSISASSILALHVGVRGRPARRFEGVHWIYFAEREYPFYRVGFYSHLAADMAPADAYSIYAEVGVSAGASNLSPLVQRSLACLCELGILDRTRVDVLIANTIADTYVHYTPGRAGTMAHCRTVLADRKVRLIGRYGNWQYSSMEDSIIEGMGAVGHIAEGRRTWDEAG